MNTPALLLIGFNRPELLKKRLEEISKMEITALYLSLDGGNESHTPSMYQLLEYSTEIFSKIADFQVIHRNSNLGLTKHITESIAAVFDKYNSVIVIEDDIVLSKNTYLNLTKGLQYLELNNLLGTVSGTSPFSAKSNNLIGNRYRKSIYFSCWGWGCNKSTWDKYDANLSADNLEESLNQSSTWRKLSKFQKKIWLARFFRVQMNPNYTWDLQMQYASFINDFHNLLPYFRFTNNEGFNDSRASHTKGKKPSWLNPSSLSEDIIEFFDLSKISNSFFKFFDSLTIAGDAKIISWLNRLRKRIS